jgi:hypothetical protein
VDNALIPTDTYPEYYRCEDAVSTAHDPSLVISSWVMTFSDNNASITIPDHAGWLRAVRWSGSVSVNGVEIASCSPRSGHIGMMEAPAQAAISGEPDAKVILFGLFAEGAPAFEAPVLPGIDQSLDSDPYDQLFAFLRAIRTLNQGSDEKSWSRGAIVVTVDGGPNVVQKDFPSALVDGLLFIAVPKAQNLSFTPGANREQDAVVLDFFCEDDIGDLGCSWRCWGP